MNAESSEDYILQRYNSAIEYYWRASRYNKRAYKLTRSLTVILGAIVTLVASLSSAEFVTSNRLWDTAFAVAAPTICHSKANWRRVIPQPGSYLPHGPWQLYVFLPCRVWKSHDLRRVLMVGRGLARPTTRLLAEL